MSKIQVQVCTGPKCKASFSEYILRRLASDSEKWSLQDDVSIETCPCTGNCRQSPTLFVDGKLHEYMNPAKASEIVQKSLTAKKKAK